MSKTEQVSRIIQSFVFDANLPPDDFVKLAGGRAESVSYITGLLIGCSHEFRTGPHANYKAHLYSLSSRPAVFESVLDTFGVARPKNPFISIGKFVDCSKLDSVMPLANEMETGGRTLCASFWNVICGDDDRAGLMSFYNDWVYKLQSELISLDRYNHESFICGLLHKLPSADISADVLALEGALRKEFGAVVNTSKHSSLDQIVTYPSDNSSEQVRMAEQQGIDWKITIGTARKGVFCEGQRVYIVDGDTLRRVNRYDVFTVSAKQLQQWEDDGKAEVFDIPECFWKDVEWHGTTCVPEA